MKPSPTLTLWRPQPEGHATALIEALITPSARRKQQLMGEDCITLDFLHDQLVELSVGDYVDTDYGRFYVATPQRATFEAETAVYHYLITLEAPHRLWGTHLMALCVAQSEGSYVRTDKQWTLTAPLSQHLDQLVANLKILGIAHPDGSNWDYVVHQESFLHTNATAARTLVYDGCSLLQALDLLASEEAYHCEWWIDGHTIHFGQLGAGQTATATIVQGIDGHFERDKESNTATRHYVIGGSTNLPNTYRRKLIFEADGELLKRGIIHDPARPLRPTFFSNFDKGLQERKVEHRFSMEQLKLFTSVGVVEGRNDDPNADDYDPNVPSEQGEDHRKSDVVLWSDEQARFTFKEGVHYNLDAKGLRLLSQQQPKGVMGETAVLALAWQALPQEKGADVVEVDGKRLRIFFRLGGAGTFDAVDTQYPTSTTRQGLYLLTTDSFLETPETADLRIEGSVKLYYAEPAAQMRLRVSVPSAGIDNAEARYADTFTDNAPEHSLLLVDEGLRGQLPSINSEFVPHGLVSAKIPLSYYIPEHHIEGLGAAPTSSLRLPLEAYPNGYIDLPAEATEAQRVERVLALPHIFPRLEMNVGEVVMGHKAAKSENESAQPHFSITDASNSLPFESSLRIEGVALRVKFESGALGGMEFAITPDFTNKRFAITPNENYGAMLPNATLRPVSGDKFVLLGFNPEVLVNGGLVEAAERELERVAREIIEQEQALSQSYELTTLPPLNPLDDAPIYRLGQSLTLSDDGSSTKPLRIVGVDHALDIPQDAPRYRLAQPRKPSLTQRLKEVGTAKASGTKVVTAGQVGGNNGRSFSTSSSSVDIDALREEMGEHFLSRLSPDVALGNITFNNGLTAKQLASFEKGATFGSYLPSLIGGRGAKVDERGNAEVESIKVRSRMEVAELVVNRQTTMDADMLLTEGDLVENVKEEANGLFTLTLRREWEGYATSLTAGAVVRGIYNDTSRGGSTFETTWLKVEQVDTANNAIRVSLYPANECPSGANYSPRPLLKISRWGHISDTTRQATYLLSSREQRVCLLTNVVKPIIDASNISSWQGQLDGLSWRDAGGQTHQLTGYGNVMGSAYVSGSLHVGGELTGAIADKVNELGEENLLLEGNVPIRNSDYMTARYYLTKNGQTLKEGDKITAVMKAHLADGRDRFEAFVADGRISVARFEPIGNNLYKFTHVWPVRVSKEGHLNDNRSIQIFAIPSNSATTTIEWVKLVRGSYASREFVPAPEDVANVPILKSRAERIIAEVEAEKQRLAASYTKVLRLPQTEGELKSSLVNLNINFKGKADELIAAAKKFLHDGLLINSVYDKTITRHLLKAYRDATSALLTELTKADKGDKGDKGDRGERGPQGLQGLQGEQGERGIPGERGADGRSSYTHIAYADNAQGGGFSQQPTGKAYMGVYVDNLPSDSNDPSRYKWSLIKGQKGDQGVQGARGADGRTPYFHTAYASSSDGRTNFHLSDPNGRSYIGVYTDYTESDSTNPTKYTWALIKGEKGERGQDGATGAKGDKGDRGERGERGPQGLQGLQGEQGERGIPGERGADGRSSYTHIAYADNAQGGGFSQQPTGKAYMGVYVDNLPSDSNDPSRYKWSLIKGQKGDQGVQGARGEDGRTPYFHTAYASSSDGRTNFHLSDPNGRSYIGVYTDYTESDSTNPTKYTWALIKGEKGERGQDGATGAKGDKGDRGATGAAGRDGAKGERGVGVREVKTQYAISTSSTQSPSSGWSDTPIEWREGYHLWRRTKVAYTDGTTVYTNAELDLSWKHERMTRLLADNLQLKEVNVGAEKGVSFAGRFEAREKQGDQQVVRSFLNGLTNGNRPAFAAGVKDFDSSTESYATAFYHNGNAHIGVLAFENSGGAGSLHIVERGNPTHKLVELTDQRMPTGEQLAQQAKTTLWMVEGRITREFSLSPVRPPKPSSTPSSYWANGYDLYPNIQEFDLDETLTIGANIRTGNGTGKIRLELFPSNSERTNLELAPPLAPDIAVAYLNGGGRSIELCRLQGIGNVEIDLSVLKDLPPATYSLSVSFTAVVGTPRVKLTASRVGYSIDPDRPTTAICGDGFMAYHNKGQYTFIKDGVLYAKGELRIPGLLAHGVVTRYGTYQSKWGSRLRGVEHHNTGAYRIWHTLGHTRYSVNATPIDAGGLKVAQIAAQYADSVWVYIKDVEGARNPQGGFKLVDCDFAFSIIGHD